MKWIVLAMLAGCGGSECRLVPTTFTRHATLARIVGSGPECSSRPAAFEVSASVSAETFSGVENGASFSVPLNAVDANCYAEQVWTEGAVQHVYHLALDGGGASALYILPGGACWLSYSLR